MAGSDGRGARALGLLRRALELLRSGGPRALLRGASGRLRRAAAVRYVRLHALRATNPDSELPATVWVAPDDVRYRSALSDAEFPPDDDATRDSGLYDDPVVGVVGGPWDRYRNEWTDVPFFRSARRRYEEGRPWAETEYYRRYMVSGDAEKGTREERCRDLDRLYDSMADRGYVPQTAFLAGAEDAMAYPRERILTIRGDPYPDETRVGIGRNGEILRFGGGTHRISYAKLLDLKSVPVVVTVRHERWQRVREAFAAADALDEVRPRYRQYADHPDVPAPDGVEGRQAASLRRPANGTR